MIDPFWSLTTSRAADVVNATWAPFDEMTASSSRFVMMRRSRVDSPLVDQGSSPNFGANPCIQRLVAGNFTAYVQNPAGIISFDWDGDGYGNPRTVGAETDIGADETDLLVVAGSYGNDTKGHNTNGWATPALPTGNADKTYIFPFSGGARLFYTDPGTPLGSTAWTNPPGTAKDVETNTVRIHKCLG